MVHYLLRVQRKGTRNLSISLEQNLNHSLNIHLDLNRTIHCIHILILYYLIVKLNVGLSKANVTMGIFIAGKCRHKGNVMAQPLYLITSIYTCDATGISNPP